MMVVLFHYILRAVSTHLFSGEPPTESEIESVLCRERVLRARQQCILSEVAKQQGCVHFSTHKCLCSPAAICACIY